MAKDWWDKGNVQYISDTGKCICCDEVMLKGKYPLVLPWEDGDNPEAYIECPKCKTKNVVEGFGDD